MGFKLTILEGSDQGREFAFDRIQVTIGRTMDNDVVLTDPGISRQHLSIRDKGGAYIVKDLGSSNGTLVNGNKVLEEVLRPGDVIMAGGAHIRFEGPTEGSAPSEKPARRSAARPRAKAAARGARPAGAGGEPTAGGRARSAAAAKARRQGGSAKARPAAGARGARGRAAAPQAGGGIKSAGIRRQAVRAEAAAQAPAAPAARGRQKKGAAGTPGQAKGGPLSRFKSWFSGLPKKKKILIISVFVLLLLVAAAGLFKGGQKIVQSIRWYDDEILTPGKQVGDSIASYGVGPVNFDCLYRATFQFKYANGRSTMVYRVGGINSKNEVDILLNGMHVAYAPITLDKYSSRLVLNLPRKHLLENDANQLQFINTVNRADPKAKDSWAVVVYSIDEQPLPPPDRKKAEEAFINANERLKNKGVAPGNLYKALEFMKQTRDYLELLPEGTRPEIYIEAADQIDKIEEELDKIFNDQVFKAEKALKFSSKAEAKEIYRLLMLTFPNKQDHRNEKAKKEYISLGGSLQEI